MENAKNNTRKIFIIASVVIITIIVLCGLVVVLTIVNKDKIKALSLNPKATSTASTAEGQEKTGEQALQLKDVEPVGPSDHILGDMGAPVQMIVYSDFACEFCAEFKDNIKTVSEEFPDDLVVAYRNFSVISDSVSMNAAMAAECADEQGNFWQMYDKLFADNIARELNYEQYLKDAEDIGLDLASFSQCYQQEKYKDKITSQYIGGRNFYVTGTPTFFLNKDIFVGAYPLDDFVRSDGEKVTGLRNLVVQYSAR